MSPEGYAAWRDYLAGRMEEQFGTSRKDAVRAVSNWLQELLQEEPRAVYRIPETSPVRKQRRGSPRGDG